MAAQLYSTNQKPPNFKNIRQKHDLTSFFIPVFGTIVDAGGFIKDSAFPVPVPNLKPDELLLLLVSVVVAPNLNPAPVIDPPRLGTTAASLELGPATTERNTYVVYYIILKNREQ